MNRARPWLPVGAMLALLVAAAFVFGSSTGAGVPLDPASSRPLGAKGLVEVLKGLGATVDVTSSAPDASATTAVVLADDLDSRTRDQLAAWVRQGGTLLLADPLSPLNPYATTGTTDLGLVDASIDRSCSVPALDGVRRIAPSGGRVLALAGEAGATGCFPRNGGYWMVASQQGEGMLVVVGGAGPFVNQRLRQADNAVFVAAILAPRLGARVAFVNSRLPGATGNRSLVDFIAPQIRAGLWQLVVAFAVFALWRARRLGRPVIEEHEVRLPASELVMARGDLLQRAKGTARAAELIRFDVRTTLAERFGLAPTIDPEILAGVVAARGGPPRDRILSVLAGPPPRGDEELVMLVELADSVRTEVLHG